MSTCPGLLSFTRWYGTRLGCDRAYHDDIDIPDSIVDSFNLWNKKFVAPCNATKSERSLVHRESARILRIQ
eukprot:scaffold12564_cov115-Amphora_coffeaeformis.AAC.1